jgi:MarR family transcriptional regulator, organic hydroperoxide resistance regulator
MSSKCMRETMGHLLAQTCKLLRVQAHAMLEQVNLYRGQQFVLCVLWEQEGITHSELAEALHVQPSTVTNALKRMEKAGLVERRHDSHDARVSRVYLTEAGRSIRGEAEEVWRALDAQAFHGFSAEEKETLGQMLTRIQENLLHEATHEEDCG